MRRKLPSNVAASVRQRLLNLAHERGEEFGFVLSRYAVERLLYRLGRSRHADSFILKGAQAFLLWSSNPHRMTRDLDLLCRESAAIPRIETIFRELCQQQTDAPDGIEFVPASIRGVAIREQRPGDGIRVMIEYHLAGAQDRVQVDIGFGDRVVPEPQMAHLPVLLDLPSPHLRVYPREAMVAEKLEAMVVHGIANSRMKDFYDLWTLAREFIFEGAVLCAAIGATFAGRGAAISAEPVGLTAEFHEDRVKQRQWAAFLRKGRLEREGLGLTEVVRELRRFLLPPLQALAEGTPFEMVWDHKHGWH